MLHVSKSGDSSTQTLNASADDLFSTDVCIFCCVYIVEPNDIFGCELGLSSNRDM